MSSPRKRPVRPPTHVPVELDGVDLLAALARFTLDPTCPGCGGRAELLPGTGEAAVDVRIEHLDEACPTVSAIT